MNRTATVHAVRLPLREEPIPPVKILDAEGRLIRVVPAEEFRAPAETFPVSLRRGRGRVRD